MVPTVEPSDPGWQAVRTVLVSTSMEGAGTKWTGRHGPTGTGTTVHPDWRPRSVVRIHRRF